MSTPTENRYLDEQGRLAQWPSKHQDKLLVLAYLASKFELGKTYTEAEINELLKTWHTFGDWPLLRRELYDRDFLDRQRDGSNYRLTEIATDLSGLTLVQPDIERDAKAGVGWLAGEAGRETLRLMGNTDGHNQPSTLDEERTRIRSFITSDDQITWMLHYEGRIVGLVWVELKPTEHVPAPAIHIMIGDASARGRGIGESAIKAVIGRLKSQDRYAELYTRHLVQNAAVAKVLAKTGFQDQGQPYRDKDGLEWQNVHLKLK